MGVASIFFPLQIDYGINSFRIEDDVVAPRIDGFNAAQRQYQDLLNDYRGIEYRSMDLPKTVSESSYSFGSNQTALLKPNIHSRMTLDTPLVYTRWSTHVIVETTDPKGNIFEPARLKQFLQIQNTIRTLGSNTYF
jgi:hypothetical protein